MGERSKQLVERSGVTRIFIRDLPEAMVKSWLKHIFLGAVKIIDVYIPRKRSFRLNQRFRFVRYRNKAEGQNPDIRRVYRVVKNNIGVGGSKGISVHQNTPRMEDQGTSTAAAGKETQVCIKVSEVGNEWLFRSAIAKLSPSRSMVYMQNHLKNLGYSVTQTLRYA
ncbi:hypothetical protein RHMOL_Rhmol02G0154200 [Rhododendron molle]|uniref:Uncharacterized protein n=1 Tax=Rhododendron molle TaxID=49168 RepID=A0ACC0PRS2_RHOML|nr:hypothetical protein RHMOL_Rhmol02G0154200 [Rhododendron molle]